VSAVRVVADRDRCSGAGMCAAVAPEVFDQSEEDGVVVVLDPEPPAGSLAAVTEAVTLCPVAAIALT
jgi:ferredoxin